MIEGRVCVRVPYTLHQGVAPEHDLWRAVAQTLREQGLVSRPGGLRRYLRTDDSLDPRYGLAVFELDTWELAENEFGLPAPEVRCYRVSVVVRQYHSVEVDAMGDEEARDLAYEAVSEGSTNWDHEDIEVEYAREVIERVAEAKAS